VDRLPFLVAEELTFLGSVDVLFAAPFRNRLDQLGAAGGAQHVDVVTDEVEADVFHPPLHPHRAARALAEDVEDVHPGWMSQRLQQARVDKSGGLPLCSSVIPNEPLNARESRNYSRFSSQNVN